MARSGRLRRPGRGLKSEDQSNPKTGPGTPLAGGRFRLIVDAWATFDPGTCAPPRRALGDAVSPSTIKLKRVSTIAEIRIEPAIPADDLYMQIVQGEVFFPLHDSRLSDQERALVFRDEATYLAFSTFLKVQKSVGDPEEFTVALDVDDLFTWDSETCGARQGSCRLSHAALG
jgi:hypothetical protein